MKRFAYCVVCILAFVMLAGASCTSSKDPNIERGRKLRNDGQANAQKTMEIALEKMGVAYRGAEKRTIDGNYSRAIAGLLERAKTQNFTPQQLLDAQTKYIEERDAALAAVDKEIAEAMQVVQWARDDRQLADQINQVLESYADAGIDISAAKVAITQLVGLIQAKREAK
jgi:hypothetical protein